MCEMSTWKHCPFHHRIQKLHLRLSFIKPPLHTTSFKPHNPAQAGEATWPRFTDEGSRWRGKSSSSELQALSLHHGNCVCLPPTFFPCFYVCKPNNILIWKNDYQHPLPSLSYHMPHAGKLGPEFSIVISNDQQSHDGTPHPAPLLLAERV